MPKALLGLALTLSACAAEPIASDGPERPAAKADGLAAESAAPSRVIVMIGDGMGIGAISGAAYLDGDGLWMLSMPHAGWISTHSHEFITTDSAAAATALSSGQKTHFEGVGVSPGTTGRDDDDPSRHVQTVFDLAKSHRWKSGVVVTTTVVDATPGGFVGHRAKRRDKDGIALDILSDPPDVIFGGGRSYFTGRDDGVDILDELRNQGFGVAETPRGLATVAGRSERAIALLADGDLQPADARERPLPELVEAAIEVLDRNNPEGFVLMVEGSQIDRQEHELDAVGALEETLDFDDAVGTALRYARKRDDTLVVVTADHETAGLTVHSRQHSRSLTDTLGGEARALELGAHGGSRWGSPPFAHLNAGSGRLTSDTSFTATFNYLSLQSRTTTTRSFFAGAHTAEVVPVFAEGPGAEYLADAIDNAELGSRLKSLVRLGGREGERESESESPPAPVQSAIVLLSDGFGSGAATASTYARTAPGLLTWSTRGVFGHSGLPVAPDAASVAGMVASSSAIDLFARAEAQGKKTALVSTTSFDDPALQALFAGGSTPLGPRPVGDGIDYIIAGGASALDTNAFESSNYIVDYGWRSQFRSTHQYLQVLAPGALEPAATREQAGQPALLDLVRVTLNAVDDAPEGFLMVIYAPGLSQSAGDFGSIEAILAEIDDIEDAARHIAAFAGSRDDVVALATTLRASPITTMDNHYGYHAGTCGTDIRCGGADDFTILPFSDSAAAHVDGFFDLALQGRFAPIGFQVQFDWLSYRARSEGPVAAPASGNMVPIFAVGRGAQRFAGYVTASDLHDRLGALIGQ